jgi:hypothetical protein
VFKFKAFEKKITSVKSERSCETNMYGMLWQLGVTRGKDVPLPAKPRQKGFIGTGSSVKFEDTDSVGVFLYCTTASLMFHEKDVLKTSFRVTLVNFLNPSKSITSTARDIKFTRKDANLGWDPFIGVNCFVQRSFGFIDRDGCMELRAEVDYNSPPKFSEAGAPQFSTGNYIAV